MVVEHVFVSALPPAEVMSRASAFLAARGFEHVRETSFPVGQDGWTALQMRRGRKNPARAKTVAELPQTVRVEYDRGRVAVAISITASAAWGASGGFAISSAITSERPKRMKLHAALLHAIARGLEILLAHDQSGQADYAAWDASETDIRAAARRRRIRSVIVLIILLGFLAVLIGAIVMAVRR
jgi:hypothetical protein